MKSKNPSLKNKIKWLEESKRFIFSYLGSSYYWLSNHEDRITKLEKRFKK